jgi:hypothetical protein
LGWVCRRRWPCGFVFRLVRWFAGIILIFNSILYCFISGIIVSDSPVLLPFSGYLIVFICFFGLFISDYFTISVTLCMFLPPKKKSSDTTNLATRICCDEYLLFLFEWR